MLTKVIPGVGTVSWPDTRATLVSPRKVMRLPDVLPWDDGPRENLVLVSAATANASKWTSSVYAVDVTGSWSRKLWTGLRCRGWLCDHRSVLVSRDVDLYSWYETLCVMRLSDGTPMPLCSCRRGTAALSPDGSLLAYSPEESKTSLHVHSFVTGETREICRWVEKSPLVYGISPDNRAILFEEFPPTQEGPQCRGAHVLRLDANLKVVHQISLGECEFPRWLSSDEFITRKLDHSRGFGPLVRVRLDGREQAVPTHGNSGHAYPSPDGKCLAIRYCDGPPLVIRTDGSRVTPFCDCTDSPAFYWSGHSRRIAHFHQERYPSAEGGGSVLARLVVTSLDGVYSIPFSTPLPVDVGFADLHWHPASI